MRDDYENNHDNARGGNGNSNGNVGEGFHRVEHPPDAPSLVPPPSGLWSGDEPVGSITSPSETGRYRMALRDYASTVQVEGSLVALDYDELDSNGHPVTKTVLCQASKLSLQNQHHETPVLRALLREKGRIPGLSGFADHKEVQLLPMDCIITGTDIHQLPRNIPPTGTNVRFASAEDVVRFSGKHHALYNIGYLYETKVPIGLMLKHFGSGPDGFGDAHMLGVFGVTGSGKTVMAMSIVAGFAAREEMGMLIIDPQGQIGGFEMGKDPKKWSWRLDEAFRLVGRGPDVRVVKIDNIALESPRLFAQLLDRNDFFEAINVMGSGKQEDMVRDLTTLMTEWLRTNSGSTLGDLHLTDDMLSAVCGMAAAQYANPAKQTRRMMDAFVAAPYKVERARTVWEQVREMFSRPVRLNDLLDDVLINRRIIILDVDAEEDVKDLYLSEILDGIKRKAESIYRIKQGHPWRGDPAGKYRDVETNAIIVIDEAHRVAPQTTGSNDDQERMRRTLVDAISTTRKLGVGWCYITQSIANFNKEIFRQIQTKVLGFGIGTGADNDHLESAFNHDKDLIERYRNLPRPLTTGVYPFAIIGELVALGNGSRALFVTAPPDQDSLVNLNPQHFKYPNGEPVPPTSTPAYAQSSNGRGRGQLATAQAQLPLPPTQSSDDVPF